jgi:hypothetical protein
VHASRRFDEYDGEVEHIVRRELAIVRSRAQVVRGLRELIRVSALLPFPIQSWWLSAARETAEAETSPSTYFNLVIAMAAGAVSLLGLFSPALVLLALPLQAAGGVAYRWTLALEPGPHRNLRRIWEIQIALIALLGLGLVLGGQVSVLGAVFWWLLGLSFAAGIYAFEHLVAKRLQKARLDE